MKITLIKDENNKTAGWTITGETLEDKLVLGSMRQLEFWGTKDTKIEYDGMRIDPEANDLVISMMYATRGYKDKSKKALYESLKNPDVPIDPIHGPDNIVR